MQADLVGERKLERMDWVGRGRSGLFEQLDILWGTLAEGVGPETAGGLLDLLRGHTVLLKHSRSLLVADLSALGASINDALRRLAKTIKFLREVVVYLI